LYEPTKSVNNSTAFYKVERICQKNENFSTLNVLFILYKNIIFDVMYFKVFYPGSYFKYFSLRSTRYLMFLVFRNIIIFLIRLIKFIFFNHQKINFHQMICLSYNNPYDHRKLLYSQNTWHHNPRELIDILKKVTNFNRYDDNILITKLAADIKKTLFSDATDTINIKLFACKHIINGDSRIHYSPFFDKNSHAAFYITDGNKAILQNYHDSKGIVIPIFEGFKKKSTLIDFQGNIISVRPSKLIIPLDNFNRGKYLADNSNKYKELLESNRYPSSTTPDMLIESTKNYTGKCNTFLKKYGEYNLSQDEFKAVLIEILEKYCECPGFPIL